MFKGFKPQGLQKIASRMGYTGSMNNFNSYLQQNPAKQNQMNMYTQSAMKMASGGLSTKSQMREAQSGLEQLENSLQGSSHQRFLTFPTETLEYLRYKPDDYDESEINVINKIYDYRSVLSPKPQVRLGDVPDGMAQGGAVRKMAVGGLSASERQKLQNIVTDAGATEYDQRQAQAKLNAANAPPTPAPKPLAPIKTMAYGEDDEGKLPGPETDPFFNIKTAMVGEDDGDMGNRPIVNQPIATTRAYGEDGLNKLPSITQAVGEDGGGGAIATTLAAGEEDGNTGLSIDPRQPKPKPKQTQAYVPTLGTGTGQTPAYGDGSTAAPDPYADYRQNVEVFPETGTFKNPKIQTSFDSMTKELKRNIGTNPTPKNVKNRSDVILNYVRNMYSGPIYQSEAGTTGLGGGQFTEEFKQYAADSGLNIVDALAADGPQLLSVQEGSPIATTPGYLPSAPASGKGLQNVATATANLAQTGAIPVGAVTQPELIKREDGQLIDPRTGQLTKTPDATTTVAGTAQADAPDQVTASTTTAATATTDVTNALQANTAAQTNPNDPNAKITAAQQTASSVGNLDAAQGNATLMENPVQREIQNGELISGVADAEKASKFTEQIQAATATPTEKATVQGQLASLTENFDANNPPAWAAGTLRAV